MTGGTLAGVAKDPNELDDLDDDIAPTELTDPGYIGRLDQLTDVVLITTKLWSRREELGLAIEDVATRSGLTLDEVDAIENNAVDTPVPNLARYAAAVGLRLDLKVTAA